MNWRSDRGFSLLELIVVLAIMALGFAFVAPNFARSLDGLRFQAAVREVADGLRQARGIAISQGREAVFFVDVTDRRYRIDRQRKTRSLPQFLELTLETAESEITGSGGNIRFFPDGSATGGRITLAWEERRRWVDVNWLTGRIDIATGTDED
ncbi:MAG TPA: type II secretion system protein GspH [Sedimenticola sp.]|nr:type II secretion system protein GspH [Sedimenticola sp.]